MGGDNQNQTSMLLQAYSTSTKLLQSTSEYFASYKFGQYIFKKIDRLLWTIEKSSQWSIPYTKEETLKANGENGREPATLVRPLPWILFLPFLLALSIFRKSSNFCAIVLGFESRMTAESIIKYIQSIRRHLRHVRHSGQSPRVQQSGNTEKQKITAILRKVYDTLISAICVPGMVYEESFIKVEKDVRIIKGSETDSDDESDDETMEAFLAKTNSFIQKKLSELSSSSIDDDYVPEDEESNDEDSIDSSEEELPVKTKVYLQKSITNQIIAEENEDSDVSNAGEVKKLNGNVPLDVQENHINDPQADTIVEESVKPDVIPEVLGEELQGNGELVDNEVEDKKNDGENKEIEGNVSEINENGQEQNGDLTSESCHNNEIIENGIPKSDINKNESFIKHEQDFQQNSAPVENGANHHENH